MNNRFLQYLRAANWPFLIFLVGVTSIKLQVKIVFIAAYLVFLLVKKVPFGRIFEGPVKFYVLMPVAGLLAALLHRSFAVPGYWFGNLTSIVIWLMCACSFLLIRVTLGNTPQEKAQRSIELFFILNGLFCLFQLAQMIIVSKHIFPYWYTELDNIYGVSTGDHLHGIFMDNSTVNAAICLMSVFYFLFVRRYAFAYLGIVICLLCTSNLTVFILLSCIFLAFILFGSQRKQVFAAGVLCVGLYLFISPSNIKYVERVLAKVKVQSKNKDAAPLAQVPVKDTAVQDSLVTAIAGQHKPAIKIEEPKEQLPPPSNATQPYVYGNAPFLYKDILRDFSGPILANLGTTSLYYNEHIPEDTMALRRVMAKWYGVAYDSLPLALSPRPGKLLYFKNTRNYLRSGTLPLLLGAGPGNFSSKMALKMTGFKLQGSYPDRFTYISRPYFENTFFVHMFFWAKSIPDRSIINYPGSVYGQVAGEYGLAGILLFTAFYFIYFFKKSWKQPQKFVLLAALLLLFLFDYWLELLTLTVFFELFMLSDVAGKTGKKKPSDAAPERSIT